MYRRPRVLKNQNRKRIIRNLHYNSQDPNQLTESCLHWLLPETAQVWNFFPNSERELTVWVSWPELFCLTTWILMKNTARRHQASQRLTDDHGTCGSCLFPPLFPHVWLNVVCRHLLQANLGADCSMEEQNLLMVKTRRWGCLATGVKQMLSPFSSSPTPLGWQVSQRTAAESREQSQHLTSQKAVDWC